MWWAFSYHYIGKRGILCLLRYVIIKNKMKKYIVSIAIPMAVLSLVIVFSASIQEVRAQVNCPAGFTCTPISSAINCPPGFVCQPTFLPSPSPTPNACYNFSRNLGIGATGDDVVRLINILSSEGVLPFRANTYNGGYDESIASAVSAFQQKYASEILTPSGLTSGTGYVGKATRAKLNQLCGLSNSNNTVAGSPVISSVSGPAFLNIGQMGTWVVGASDPQSAELRYSIDWGDETMMLPVSSRTLLTASFTHSYIRSGTYTAKFTVQGANGRTATSNLVINVSSQVSGTQNSNLSISSVGSPGNPNFQFYPGDRVTIVGSGFDSASYVAWGGANGSSIMPISFTPYNLTFTAPNIGPGTYTIQVMEKAGSAMSNAVNVTLSSWNNFNTDDGVCPSGQILRGSLCVSASSQSTASVALISPQAYSTLTSGSPTTISWSATGNGYDKYQIVVGNSVMNSERQLYDRVSMVDFIPAYQTSFQWNVPDLLSDFAKASNYSYDQIKNSFYLQVKLVKSDSAGGSYVASSNRVQFSVQSGSPVYSTQPNITTISPSQGTANTAITIYGTNLTNVSEITFSDSSGRILGSVNNSVQRNINVSSGGSSLQFVLSNVFAFNVTGNLFVRVVTPTGTSNALAFRVYSPSSSPSPSPSSSPVSQINQDQMSASIWDAIRGYYAGGGQ